MTFEAKKTYRTKRGRTAQVCNDHGSAHGLPYRIVVLGDAAWADRDGMFGDDRMLPGAIEDEQPDIDVIAGMAATIEENVKQIGTLQKTLLRLIDHLGLMVGDYGRVYPKPEPKPTVKGGWMNVWRDDSGNLEYGKPYPNQGEAMIARSKCSSLHFVACIQIPDITEGEGL